MKINDWIDCYINAFNYFDGVTCLLIPDNLKTGVANHKKYEDSIISKAYLEMADLLEVMEARCNKKSTIFIHGKSMREEYSTLNKADK